MTAESDGGGSAHTFVQVYVEDINDNSPRFLEAPPKLTVIEEDDRDLPLSVAKVNYISCSWNL